MSDTRWRDARHRTAAELQRELEQRVMLKTTSDAIRAEVLAICDAVEVRIKMFAGNWQVRVYMLGSYEGFNALSKRLKAITLPPTVSATFSVSQWHARRVPKVTASWLEDNHLMQSLECGHTVTGGAECDGRLKTRRECYECAKAATHLAHRESLGGMQ